MKLIGLSYATSNFGVDLQEIGLAEAIQTIEESDCVDGITISERYNRTRLAAETEQKQRTMNSQSTALSEIAVVRASDRNRPYSQ